MELSPNSTFKATSGSMFELLELDVNVNGTIINTLRTHNHPSPAGNVTAAAGGLNGCPTSNMKPTSPPRQDWTDTDVSGDAIRAW